MTNTCVNYANILSNYVINVWKNTIFVALSTTNNESIEDLDPYPFFGAWWPGKGVFNFNDMALNYYEQLQHPNWQRKRLQIFERDNFACKICGNTEHQLQVHHLYYIKDILLWEYDDELLQTVCETHHKQLSFDMPKISGILAFKILQYKIDIVKLNEIIEMFKYGR